MDNKGILLMTVLLCSHLVIHAREKAADDVDVKTYARPDTTLRIENSLNTTGLSGKIDGSFRDMHISGDSTVSISMPKRWVTIPAPKEVGAPGTAVIPLWRGGALIGTGSTSEMPGLMAVESGTFGFGQTLGNFSLYAGGIANKYGWYQGLHTQYGVNGTMRYAFTPNLSVTGFGTYYFGETPHMANGMSLAPAMVGYYNVSIFGGYASYQFNETFGIDVGGQAVQQFGTNRYRFEPIVTPTFKVGKVKFGLPVGQMLNGIIRSRIEGRR